MSFTSNEKTIKELLLALNINKKEVTRTVIEFYSHQLKKLKKKYQITIWTKKKVPKDENNPTGPKKVKNYPETYFFNRQVDVLIFLSKLASNVINR